MAAQQVLFSETVAGMKKALKRTAYDSDSDNEIEHYSNRGHKLKKRALFAHRGQLVPPSGPEVYKKEVEYAGQHRAIISRNPPVLDDEGYELDSDDDEQRVQNALASANEANPYANIRLEQVLGPLIASTDLPTHPTLSKPFTTKTLTDLSEQSCAIMRKENHSLWRVKHLFTRLTGDHVWVPCEMMLGPNDIELFSDDPATLSKLRNAGPSLAGKSDEPETNGQVASNGTGAAPDEAAASAVAATATTEAGTNGTEDADVSMTDVGTNGVAKPAAVQASVETKEQTKGDAKPETPAAAEGQLKTNKPGDQEPKPNGEVTPLTTKDKDEGDKNKSKSNSRAGKEPAQEPQNQDVSGDNDVEMRQGDADGAATPSQAGAGAVATPSAEALSVAQDLVEELFIHPIFHPPPHAQVDRGGLSEAEADEMRRLVALYVQKQEEVCRGANKLHEGLLKANRLRQTVLQWSKAEAHSGPNRDMSDGEDWYDKEEWGLAEDLKKGQDEEEEDTGTATKKTRNRR